MELPAEVDSARAEIHQVISQHASTIIEEEDGSLIVEWVLMVNVLDDEGDVRTVRLSSENMLRTHSIGLLVDGLLNGGLVGNDLEE